MFLNLIFKYVKGQTLLSFLVGILPYSNVIARSFSRMIQVYLLRVNSVIKSVNDNEDEKDIIGSGCDLK